MKIEESHMPIDQTWYFGNNRSKNLRLSPPHWSHPFFVSTDYGYAEEYSDYGVYQIDLKPEAQQSILDFSSSADIAKLHWPKRLVSQICLGKSDLNGIAYDLYALAFKKNGKLYYIDNSPEWIKIAQLFKARSTSIFKQFDRSVSSTWGQDEDHRFLLQMWKDIYDAGFSGFMHIEFGSRCLAIFDFHCIDKISIQPIQKALQEDNCQMHESKATYIAKFKDEKDVQKIAEMFWNIRDRLHAPQNDIDWWIKKPYADFKKFVLSYDPSSNKKTRRDASVKQQAIDNGAKMLDVVDGYEIWYVPTYDAMVQLGRFYKGQSAKWCVASDDPEFWFDNHSSDEFVLLIREQPQHDEFDKIALQMEDGGRYYSQDNIIPWDIQNNDWTFTDDDLVHRAWMLFKGNGETREEYY